MRQAVFLDRDGTICREVGYLSLVEQLQLLPGAAEAIGRLNRRGLSVIVITNQSGVARGYFSESILGDIHDRLREELARFSAHVEAIYYCPHHPDGILEEYRTECRCRKPGIGLLERAALEHNLDLATSFVVGDKYLDIETGVRAGTRTLLVLTGYGQEEYQRRNEMKHYHPDHVAADLSDAVDWILTQPEGPGHDQSLRAGTIEPDNNRE
jgi:D-glycero-D-manno-heptose 1,7-bisphosphate phosphatase